MAAPSFAAFCQPPQTARIGYLHSGLRNTPPTWITLMVAQLSGLGWVEGRNLKIERRYAEGHEDRLQNLAAELVRLKVDLIMVSSLLEARPAQQATRSIPIVTVNATDPVATGFAKSLAHPGGNVTGVLWADPAFSAKGVQLMKEAVPSMRKVAVLYTEIPGIEPYLKATKAAAQALGIDGLYFPIATPEAVSAALDLAKKQRVDAVRSSQLGVLAAAEAQIRAFASANKLPDFYPVPDPVERGGFMAYSPMLSENATRAASIVDKILRGAKPADTPFEYPTRTHLLVNNKSAKERGITVPQSLLLRADRVIE